MSMPPYDPPPTPGGYVAAAQPPRTGMAMTALVFGILGLICSFGFIFGLIGVIVGLIALARISGDPQRFGARPRIAYTAFKRSPRSFVPSAALIRAAADQSPPPCVIFKSRLFQPSSKVTVTLSWPSWRP